MRRYLISSDSRCQHLIAIDPGLGGTGWALWSTRHQKPWGTPMEVGIVRDTAKDESLAIRCEELSEKIRDSLNAATGHWNVGWHHNRTYLYLEMPQHMTNVKGIAAQAGAVYKLTFLVGYLAKAFHQCTVHVVTPNEWKGQLQKDVVIRRIQRTLTPERCDDLGIKTHAWDAVGIGLWAMGRF
jgi:hypothetical protein